MLGFLEEKVITPRVSLAGSRGALALYRLAAPDASLDEGASAQPGTTRLTTGRVGGTLDLAAMFHLFSGDDLIQQCRWMSRREEFARWRNSIPSLGRSGRKTREGGHVGCGTLACLDGLFTLGCWRTAFGGYGTP